MKSLLIPHAYKKIGWILLVPSLLTGLFFMFGFGGESPFGFGGESPSSPRIWTFGYFGQEFLSQPKSPIRLDKIELIPNLIGILLLIGGILVMFSKEKKEDEYINQIRLNSFQNSVFFNYILLFFCIVFIHGIPFFHVMIYNLFTIILIYILRFHFLIYKNAINE
jgi:hypothetical protein